MNWEIDYLWTLQVYNLRLLSACQTGYPQIVNYALDLQEEMSGVPLIHAARNGHFKIVQILLDRGVGIDIVQDALFEANYSGHVGIVKLLVQHGAVIVNGLLNTAAQNGDRELVQLLIDLGADVAGHSNDWTVLRSASQNGHVEIVRLLLDHGADPAARDNEALQAALRKDYGKTVRLLSERS
jgi:ankyrin repeat protein